MATLANSSGCTSDTALETIGIYLNIRAHCDSVVAVQGQWHSSFSLPPPIHPSHQSHKPSKPTLIFPPSRFTAAPGHSPVGHMDPPHLSAFEPCRAEPYKRLGMRWKGALPAGSPTTSAKHGAFKCHWVLRRGARSKCTAFKTHSSLRDFAIART